MAYTKNKDPWISTDIITTDIMNNFETIYTQAKSYLTAHNHNTLYYTKSEMDTNFFHAGNDGSGSGTDADLIYKSTGNLHAASLGTTIGINIGVIILWYGSVASIPAGWHLCDGTNGTTDMRGKIPLGAGGNFTVGSSGGAATFTPTGTLTVSGTTLTINQMGRHRHPWNDNFGEHAGHLGAGQYMGGEPESRNANLYTSNTGDGGAHTHSTAEGTAFTGNSINSLPPYYALCYIQKIS